MNRDTQYFLGTKGISVDFVDKKATYIERIPECTAGLEDDDFKMLLVFGRR